MEPFPIPAPAFNGSSRSVNAGSAFDWLRQGWALFIAYPGQWLALTVVLLVLQLGLYIVPLIGSLAAWLLAPMLAAGVLHACRKAMNGEAPEIPDLFSGFRHRTSELTMLGVFSMAGMLLILLVIFVIGGGGVMSGIMTRHPAGIGLAFGGVMLAMLLSLVLSVPLLMALWFAPALVFFNRMPPVEALKGSFNACLKNALPFLIYGLIVMVMAFFAALPVFLGYLVLVPVISGSVYAAYRDIFIAD